MKYIIILSTVIFTGCATQQFKNDSFHLLHVEDNLARKSVTQDDYIIKEDC